jgi:hypothetical protein
MLTQRDNFSLGCAGLAAGTGAGTFKTTNPVAVQTDGRTFFKAASDNLAWTLFPEAGTPALPALAANQTCVYFVLVDPTGAVSVKTAPKNAVVIGPNGGGYTPGAVEWPQEDKGYACLGAIRVMVGTGAFTPGTTSLAAANQTVTYFNCGPDLGVPIPV